MACCRVCPAICSLFAICGGKDPATDAARNLGYKKLEQSWLLEDNLPMRRICEAVGSKVYKTYRIYEKAIA